MTISDDQIKALAVLRGFKLTNETGDDLKPYVYEFARELIALAQQVKPLEWELNCAKSPFGRYFTPLNRIEDMYSVWRDGCFVTDQMFYTETAARAAAQQDYRKRVLSNLVHGGTND